MASLLDEIYGPLGIPPATSSRETVTLPPSAVPWPSFSLPSVPDRLSPGTWGTASATGAGPSWGEVMGFGSPGANQGTGPAMAEQPALSAIQAATSTGMYPGKFPGLSSQFDPQQLMAYNARFRRAPLLGAGPVLGQPNDPWDGLRTPGQGRGRASITVRGGVPTLPQPITTRMGTNGYIYQGNQQTGWTQVGKQPDWKEKNQPVGYRNSQSDMLREGGGYYKSPGTGSGGSLIG